jgi:queuine tRNA-ribosyltransferase
MTTAFEPIAADPKSSARAGRLRTAHGVVETPVFMPVGTQATVKCMAPGELRELGAQIILGNTYHLVIRPGVELIAQAGGLHKFMGWDGPILTDSGGYQVFSLAKLRKISRDGVEFQSHVDGATLFLGPREAMAAQAALGSDIAMAFDECPHWPCDREYACSSLELTLEWAARCREESGRRKAGNGRQLLFGIVQGSVYADLRERGARELVAMDFDGYAIGGVSVGEPAAEMMRQVEMTVPFLPADRPRYLMGVGTPPQILEMIARGVDMFDCVLPTRVARNGTVFTTRGTYAIRNARYRDDFGPLEEGCECTACRQFSRAYIRHLFWANEILGLRLMTCHNLHVYLNTLRRAREAIGAGAFEEFRQEFVANYGQDCHSDPAVAGEETFRPVRLRSGRAGSG